MRISDWSSDVCSSDLVSLLIFGGPARNQAGRAAVIDAELALQAVGGFLLTCKLQHQRMHLKIDARQVVGGNAFFTQLHASIDAWMNNNTAGERLVRVERNLEALTQLIGNFVPVVLERNHLDRKSTRMNHSH